LQSHTTQTEAGMSIDFFELILMQVIFIAASVALLLAGWLLLLLPLTS